MIRNRPRKNFTMVSNEFVRDHTLSRKAKALLLEMLSFPDDWTYRLTHLAKLSTDGEHATRSAMKELIEHTYIVRERGRDENGKFGSFIYYVADYRQVSENDDQDDTQSTCGFSTRGSSPSGFSQTTKTVCNKTVDTKTKTPPTPPTDFNSSADFDEDLEEDETMTTEKQNHAPVATTQSDEPTSPAKPEGTTNETTSSSSQGKDKAGDTISQNHSGGNTNYSAAALPSAAAGKVTPADNLAFATGSLNRHDDHRYHLSALKGTSRAVATLLANVSDNERQMGARAKTLREHVTKYGATQIISLLEEAIRKASSNPWAYYERVYDTFNVEQLEAAKTRDNKIRMEAVKANAVEDGDFVSINGRVGLVTSVNANYAAVCDPDTGEYMGDHIATKLEKVDYGG